MSKEIVKEEATSPSGLVPDDISAFASLRGVQWRINLGILPSSSIDDLRRVTADSRRRYAGLRRQLLVDPHLPKDGAGNSPDLVMDNPLSLNPDSTWSQFFRNAELEKMVNQDLSRLYPEHENYFQTPGCQGMLRRILLLWCLRHPDCGYRQGMHELLAPLLYVLHIDVERLSEVRKLYEDQFIDKFDGFPFEENGGAYNFDFKKFSDSVEDMIGSQGNSKKVCSLYELDPEIQAVVLLSDAYGAEGELGIVLSEKFLEHDAYCMFDALMIGTSGSVAMADFFASSPAAESQSSLPPVIEASAALYHLLSTVDSSLHTHLVELGVEPQYFALRWLRVLFGREFSLQHLLVVWDEIFSEDISSLSKASEDANHFSFKLLTTRRGALIAAIAVSMILYLRSSLLATETATSCLQRLLNFPESINLNKLIEKAKSLQILALESNKASLLSACGAYNCMKSPSGHNVSSVLCSAKAASLFPDSYWEEKWRVHHKAEELRKNSLGKLTPSGKKRWSERVKFGLTRTESDPSPAIKEKCKKDHSVRRGVLEDLSKQLGLEEEAGKGGCFEASVSGGRHSVEVRRVGQNCANGGGAFASEENSSTFSDPPSPGSIINDHENDTEKSSFMSNLSVDDNDDHRRRSTDDLSHQVSLPPEDVPQTPPHENGSSGKSSSLKLRRHLSGRFQWFRKFRRSIASEEKSNKQGDTNEAVKSPIPDSKSSTVDSNKQGITNEAAKPPILDRRNSMASSNRQGLTNEATKPPILDRRNSTGGSNKRGVTNEAAKPPIQDSKSSTSDSSAAHSSCNSHPTSKDDTLDQNRIGTLKNLGQAMLDHIQVLESVFQHEQGQIGSLDSSCKTKGQATAITALKELRKISNLLSQM